MHELEGQFSPVHDDTDLTDRIISVTSVTYAGGQIECIRVFTEMGIFIHDLFEDEINC